MNRVKQKLIKEGRMRPDGRNAQAVFFNIHNIPCWPDSMNDEEELEYIRELQETLS